MANQYQAVRDQRKGTATMTIEPKPAPEPHNEILDLPDKSGRTTQGGIVPSPKAVPGSKVITVPTHPGEFGKSEKYSPVTKT
jgi:hypothetical protein